VQRRRKVGSGRDDPRPHLQRRDVLGPDDGEAGQPGLLLAQRQQVGGHPRHGAGGDEPVALQMSAEIGRPGGWADPPEEGNPPWCESGDHRTDRGIGGVRRQARAEDAVE
jgi:hypothetical protein